MLIAITSQIHPCTDDSYLLVLYNNDNSYNLAKAIGITNWLKLLRVTQTFTVIIFIVSRILTNLAIAPRRLYRNTFVLTHLFHNVILFITI